MKICNHPVLPISITFDAGPHTYTDDRGIIYKSITTLVNDHFPPFDADAKAREIAKRTGRLEMEILAEWKAKGVAASDYGTQEHLYAECVLNGTDTPQARNANEARAFRIIDKALVALAESYDLLPPEQIIFDPLYEVAGTIDLPAINKRTGALAIIDWKTNEGITKDSYRKYGLKPIPEVPDSKFHRYSLQLSLYAEILTGEMSAYESKGQPTELLVVHIPPVGLEPVLRPMDDLKTQAFRVLESRRLGLPLRAA